MPLSPAESAPLPAAARGYQRAAPIGTSRRPKRNCTRAVVAVPVLHGVLEIALDVSGFSPDSEAHAKQTTLA